MNKKTILWAMMLLVGIALASCTHDLATKKISQPDEYKKVYEAKEKTVLRAVAAVIREKEIGSNVVIDYQNRRIESDFVISGDWRTKTTARVRQLNWKECELTLFVTTEKKTKEGWEMLRLLEKEQYEKFFGIIEIKIYEEMSKAQ